MHDVSSSVKASREAAPSSVVTSEGDIAVRLLLLLLLLLLEDDDDDDGAFRFEVWKMCEMRKIYKFAPKPTATRCRLDETAIAEISCKYVRVGSIVWKEDNFAKGSRTVTTHRDSSRTVRRDPVAISQ